MISVLSFDVEEWFHGVPDFSPGDWPSKESTLAEEFDLVAGPLAEKGRSGTFFVLGEVARAHPQLVRRMAECGWEVASHGSGHGAVYESTEAEFREGLRRSVGELEEITGEKVRGFRAPMWSMRPGCEWAVEVMLSEGIEYDSSLLISGRRDPRGPFLLSSGRAEIIEVPPSPVRLAGCFYPLAGGFSQRLVPRLFYRRWLRRAARRVGYLHAFFHPWELSTRRRDLGGLTWEKRFFFSVGRGAEAAKYGWLLDTFEMSSVAGCIDAVRERALETVVELEDITCYAVKKSGWLQTAAGSGGGGGGGGGGGEGATR